MPTSTCEPVNAALRHALSSEGTPCGGGALDSRLVGSAKRVLLSHIEFEPPETYKSSVLDTLSKCIVLSTKQANEMTPEANKDEENLLEPRKVLFPLEDVQLGWRDSGWGPGAGMINTGNTCYLNSTLQALFHVPALVNWFLSDHAHRSSCNGCMVCAVANTLLSSQSQTPIKPLMVSSKLRTVCRHLIPGRQEDAHEFLRYLVEAMERAYLQRYQDMNLDARSKETTPLNQILGGYLRSAVRCLHCGHLSTTVQHFQDLLLDIRKANTLDEALAAYFARERLDDLAYRCEACKRKVPAEKQFSMERAPYVLCVQLKRFAGAGGGKFTKHVSFRQRLQLTNYAHHKSGQPLVYRLVALITHMGMSANCGHYTAIAQSPSGSYYEFDDGYVRPVSQQTVLNTNAYIMFYELEQECALMSKETTVNGKVMNKTKPAVIQYPVKMPATGSSDTSSRQSSASSASKSVESSSSSSSSASHQSATSSLMNSYKSNNLIPTPVRTNLALAETNGPTRNSNCTVVSTESSSESNKSTSPVKSTDLSSNTTVVVYNGSDVLSVKNVVNSEKTNNVNKLSLTLNDSVKLTSTHSPKLNGLSSSPKKRSKSPDSTNTSQSVNESREKSCSSSKNILNGVNSNSSRKLVPYESDEGSESDAESTEAPSGHWMVSVREDTAPSLNGKTGWRKSKQHCSDQEPSSNTSNGATNGSVSNNNTVTHLMRMSHSGYGASVSSWSGNRSALEKEVANERREQFKRQRLGDEYDAGRMKKNRHNGDTRSHNLGSGYNPFQEFHNENRKWHTARSSNGSSFHKNYYNTTVSRYRKKMFNHQRHRYRR